MNITVVISTFNRLISLKRTLDSLKDLPNEIIIIDNAHDDQVKQLAKQYKAHAIGRHNNAMLNVNKNFGFSKAKSDWILNLDDDEVLTDELRSEIQDAVSHEDKNINGYWIPRKNIIFGKWIEHGIWWPDPQLRLFRKGYGKFPEQHVHEYLEVSGKSGNLHEAMLHYNYDSVSQFLHKMETLYTPSEVNKIASSGYNVLWYDAIRFPLSDFLKVYFAQHGYKDGLHGLVLSLLQAFYSFIVFVKLWEKEQFVDIGVSYSQINKELENARKEIYYWRETATMEEASGLTQKAIHKIKRKIASL